jgi:hypothetical protein
MKIIKTPNAQGGVDVTVVVPRLDIKAVPQVKKKSNRLN